MKPAAKGRTIGIEPAAVLLAVCAFLAPIIGGQVSLDAMPLTGGFATVLSSFFTAGEAPYSAHALLAALSGLSLIWALLRRRVVQVPDNRLSGVLLIFFALFTASCALSSFQSVSMAVAAEWLSYGVAFYAVVASVGRRMGPRVILAAMFGGTVVVALKGLMEYGVAKAADPSWRIFSYWNNPNALAAMLLVGFFVGLGLLNISERATALLAAVGLVVIGLALALTGSKAALLVLIFCVLLYLLLIAVLLEGRQKSVALLRTLGVVVGFVIAVGFLVVSQSRPGPGTPGASGGGALSRVGNAGATAEQSAGFRLNLWRTSLQLVKANPAGYGAGTFRFYSGRPGITTQTQFAHSTYAQLMVEGDVLLPFLLVGALVFWLVLVLRGARTLPPPIRCLLVSVIVAVGAASGHGLVDSDLYYYGLGLSFFMLLGVGLLLSGDCVAPEFLFPAIRRLGAAMVGLILLVMAHGAYTEVLRGEVREAIRTRDAAAAQQELDTLHSIAPIDGEAWYLAARVSGKVEDAAKAVSYAPRTRNLRLLATRQLENGQNGEAMATLDRAIQLDPNNGETLYQAATLAKSAGNMPQYESLLRRLVATENTTYFKTRSVPEDVPVETYLARIELANIVPSEAERRELLRGAVEGFKSFLGQTVPKIVMMSKNDPPIPFNGKTPDEAKGLLNTAAEAAQRLATLDRKAGDLAGAKDAEAARDAFLGGIK